MFRSLFILSVLVCCLAQKNSQYSSRYDGVNPDTLMKNDRILLGYYNCIMERGPCNKDGRLFKHVLPQALRTNCAFCTAHQTRLVKTMMRAVKTKNEQSFEDMISKFDGNGKYRESMLEFILGPREDA